MADLTKDRDDRTVHAVVYTDVFKHELVRYDGPGKWYEEQWEAEDELVNRVPLNLAAAVRFAIRAYTTKGNRGVFYFGRMGGSQFDMRVRDSIKGIDGSKAVVPWKK